jgi:ribosomal protein L7/L12
MNGMSEQPLSLTAIAALHAGNKIKAIKITRVETGLGLKESKERVEAYIETDLALKEQLKGSAGGGVGWIFMVLVALAAIIYFWPRGT